MAQTVPSIVNPIPPPPTQLPQEGQPAPGAPETGEPAPGAAPEGAEAITTEINAIEVEGSTVYDSETLKGYYGDLIGQRVPVSRVFDAARAITDRYRADGYILSRAFVPEQRVTDGRFVIRVIEGYVSEVVVQGDVGPVREQVLAFVQHITEHRPANRRDIERYLLLARDLPGISLNGTFRAAVGSAGARQLVVTVARVPINGLVAYDNRGSRFIGPGEITGLVDFNSFTEFGEQLQLIYFNTLSITQPTLFTRLRSTDEQRFGQATGSFRVGDDGLVLRVFAGAGPSAPGFTLEPLRFYSDLQIAGAALTYPIIRSRRENLSVTGQFDVLNSSTRTGDDQLLTSETALRVFRLTFAGDLVDGWDGTNTAAFTYHRGVDFLDATGSGTIPLSPRAGARSAFDKITFDATRTQKIFYDENGAFSGYVAVTGQYSTTVLYPPEQLRLGGFGFGRGYFNGRLVGDHGVAGTVEARYDLATGWTIDGQPFIPQIYGFYDVGRIWSKADGEIGTRSLSSAGLGLRSSVGSSLQIELEVARPLTQPVLDVFRGPSPKPPAEIYTRISFLF